MKKFNVENAKARLGESPEIMMALGFYDFFCACGGFFVYMKNKELPPDLHRALAHLEDSFVKANVDVALPLFERALPYFEAAAKDFKKNKAFEHADRLDVAAKEFKSLVKELRVAKANYERVLNENA